MSVYEALNRKKKKKDDENNSPKSSLGMSIGSVRQRTKSANLQSFFNELATSSNSLYSITNEWQSPETMKTSKAGIESMYKKIGEYSSQYSDIDLTDIQNAYKFALDNWDDLAFVYGNYKSADEYNKANKEAEERNNYLSTVSIPDLQAQLDDVNKQKSSAKSQLSSADYNFKKLDNGRNKPKYGVSPEAHSEAKTAYDSAKNAYFGLEENASNLQRDITLATRAQSLNALTAEAQKARGYDPEAGTAIAQGKMLADKATKETSETWNPGTQSNMTSYTDNAKDTKQLIEFGTDAEKEAYYYFLGTGQTDKAKEYRDGLKESLNAREGRAWRKEAGSYFEKLGVGARAGLEQFVSGIEGALNFSGRYIPTKPSQYAAQEIRQELTQDANYLGRLGFDVANTGANMAPSIALGFANPIAGTATMGVSAGGNEYQNMINQGYSQGQAYTMGVLTGASEALLQKAMGGFGALGGTSAKVANAVSGLKSGLAKFAIRWGGSIASEALEEGAQEILAPIFKSIATGEAPENVDWGEVAYSALLGGLLGVGEGVSIGANVIGENRTGRAIRKANQAQNLFDAASLSPEESQAYEIYTKYANKGLTGEKLSNAQLGDLYNKVNDESGIKYQVESAKKDISRRGLSELNNNELEASTPKQKSQASANLDNALSMYTTARSYVDKYEASNEKLTEVQKGVYEKYTTDAEAKRKAKLKKEIDKLSSGVQTSVVSKTGKAVDIKGLKDENTLITSEGEVALKDVSLSDKDAEVVYFAKTIEQENPNLSRLFVEQYDGKTDFEQYANDFGRVAYYAKHNGFTRQYILEHKGSLSTEQVTAIYSNTVIAEARQMEEEHNKLISATASGTPYRGYIDDSIFRTGKVKYSTLSARQKKAVEFLKVFATKSGMNLEFTPYSKDTNGSFSAKDNTIYVSVGAGIDSARGMLNDTIIPTASHEVTHWMKEKSPELYLKLKEKVFEALKEADPKLTEADRIAYEIARLDKQHKGKKHTAEDATDEIVARACEDMLAMSKEGRKMFDSLSAEEQKTFIDKVKEIIENLKKWIDEFLSSYGTQTEEARALRNYKDKLEEMSEIWDQMLVRSIEVNQALEKADVFGHLENGISEDGTTIVGENNLQMSEKTYYDGGRDFLVKWLSKRKDLTKADKEDIVNQTDRIASLMRAIAEGNDLPDYSRWADMEVVKTEDGEAVSVIVSNGDYKLNIDFSQVCKKRVALEAILNAMVTSGDLNTYVLTETDIAELNDIIKKHDFEIACALCFVDAKRYRVGAWADSFCEGAEGEKDGKSFHKYGFNEMVRSLIPKGSKLQADEFNFTNRDIKDQPTKNLLSEAKDSELDFSLIDKIMADNDVRSAQHRYARAIKENPEIRKILNSAEIISSIGLDNIRVKAPSLYKLINGHQGTAKPKFAHSGVAYGNNILQARGFTAKTAKMVGGVRCQSFSDFMANMVVDYAQFISELAAKKLTAHSYTKEPLFVKLFGLTGMKINMSLVPKAIDMTPEQQKYFAILKDKNADKKSKEYKEKLAEYEKLSENAGLDENGNYIWEDETFPYDIAMDLVVDRRYSKNCGTIAVGISKKHIRKLLADDRISMVIPYHKSSLNHEVAMMRDIALYNDYTDVQNTRDKETGKKLDKDKGQKDFDFYGDLYGIGGKKGTHDPKQTAQNYREWCEEHNYIPKFDDFAGDPNYYKLLIDFRVYDVDGTYTEQQPVKTIYPPNEEFSDLILNGVKDKNGKVYGGLKQQQETSDRLDVESQQIVDEFKQRLAEKYGDDVQFSDKNTESVYDLMGENKRLAEEKAKLTEDVGRLKELLKLEKTVTKGKYAKNSTLLSAASIVRKQAHSNYDKVSLARQIGTLYTDIYENPNISNEELVDRLKTIAADVVSEAKVEKQVDYFIKEVLGGIKKTRVSLDEKQIAEMEYRFGPNWRKRFFNRIIIDQDAIPLDSKWQEWSDPESPMSAFFDADVNSADQIGKLYDLIDTLREASERVIEYDYAEQVNSVAEDIWNSFWHLVPYESTADKYTKEIAELKSKHKQMMSELRTKRDAREKEKLAKRKERYQEAYKNLKERKDAQVAHAKELGRQKLAEHKESARRAVLLRKIYATGTELAKTIQHPTKDKHIPEFLHPFVNYVLESLDFSSKQLLGDKGTNKENRGTPTKRDQAILPLLESLHSSLASNSKIDIEQNLLIEMDVSGIDDKISKIISDLQKRTDSSKLTLVHLDSESLHLISTALSDLKHIINNANAFYTLKQKHTIRNLANEEMDFLMKVPRLGQFESGSIIDKAQAAVFFEMTNPIWFFDRLGPAGQQIFESLMKAQGKYAYLAAEIQQKADKLVDKKFAKTLREKSFKFKLKQGDDGYAEFAMSAPQIMSLYLLAKQEHSRTHLFGGDGMTLTQVVASKGAAKTFGKVEDVVFVEKGETVHRPRKNILLNQETFGEIISKFREELGADADKALAVADELQQYMATKGAELGNEVSMIRFGYNAFTNPEYYPIKVTPGQVNIRDQDSGKTHTNLELAIFAKGMLKERVEGSKQSVEVADIFATFSNHMTEVAQYNAFALPILDAYKFFHYKEKIDKEEMTVQDAIKIAYTDNAWKYVTDLIKDLNGEGKSSDKSMLLDIFSNTKAAAVGARLKTALLQPTSYLRAEAVIGGKYLTKALALSPKVLMRGVENSVKYCGIVKWKSLGYYNIGISPSMQKRIEKAETTREVLVEMSMKGMAIGDTFTLGMLWNACELEIRDTRKDLAVGSKEFNEAVSDKLTEVVYRTQVVDSPLTKSPMLKNQGPIKLLATFASETIVTYNLLTNTFYNYAIDKNVIGEEAAKKKHGAKIRKMLTAHLLTSIAVAMLETLATEWWYDDDDEEKNLLDVFKVFLHNAGLNLTVVGQLPVLRDVVSAISGYTNNSLATRFISNTIGAGKAWGKMFDSPDVEKFWKALGKSFASVSDLTGIPLANAWKEVQALLDKFGADF